MEEIIKEFLNEGLVRESHFKRAIVVYNKYFPDGERKFMITRKDVNNGGNDFRTFLSKEVKSIKSRNTIILALERFFEFLIQYQSIMKQAVSELEIAPKVNPFCRKWDSFKSEAYYGTKRLALDIEVIEDLKMVLLEKENSSVRNLLYTLLCLPLRGIQAQLLDSGLSDDWIYSGGEMIKNTVGIKRRSFGVFRILNGQRYFYVNTNKTSQPYLIPCIDDELWQILLVQRESMELIDRKLYGKEVVSKGNVKINIEKYDFLFRNEDGRGVRKNQLYKMWTKLCIEVEDRFGWELTNIVKGKKKFAIDLHSLRVSLISHFMESQELGTVSRHLSGHDGVEMTLGYYRNNKSLSHEIKLRENLIEYKE